MATLTLTTIQSGLFWENPNDNRRMLEEKIASIPSHSEVVILPEMFSTGFSMNPHELAEPMDGDTVSWMKEMSLKYKIVLAGSLMIKEAGEFFNRLICMLPNGSFGYYDKRHLFGFAAEDRHYQKGKKRLIASIKGWRINFQVCYDLRFPVWSRQQISAEQNECEYDVLIYVANWPEKRSHAWKTLLCARAIENQSFVLGVNRVGKDGNDIVYSGDSMVIDPLGQVLYHMQDEEDIFTITISKDQLEETRLKFPFWKDADQFRIDE